MTHFAGTAQSGSLKVMVAEEDARLRRIVRWNLQRDGFDSEEASTLAECEERLRQGDVSLVIISSQLPGFDAQQFSCWLRTQFPERAVPVVILSFEPEDRLLTLPLRLAAFRRKPFDPEDLVTQVGGLMRPA
jgi:DNA-binding response OmpR family regulator